MRLKTAASHLFALAALSFSRSLFAQDIHRIPVRVVVANFEAGADAGDVPGEYQAQATRTRVPIRVNASKAPFEMPSSVIRILTTSGGQITAGLIMPTLLESATTITCLACLAMARKTAASSGSMVVAPRFGSTPHTPINTRSMMKAFRDSSAAGPTRENAPAQRILPPVRLVPSPVQLLSSMPMFTALV